MKTLFLILRLFLLACEVFFVPVTAIVIMSLVGREITLRYIDNLDRRIEKFQKDAEA